MKDESNPRPDFDELLIVRGPSQNIGKALMRAWWGPCLLLVEQLQPEYQLTSCVTRSQVNPIYAALGRLSEARCAFLLPSLLPGLLPSLLPPSTPGDSYTYSVSSGIDQLAGPTLVSWTQTSNADGLP